MRGKKRVKESAKTNNRTNKRTNKRTDKRINKRTETRTAESRYSSVNKAAGQEQAVLAPGIKVVELEPKKRRDFPLAPLLLIIIILILISFAPAIMRESSEHHADLHFIDMKDYPKYSEKGNAVDFTFRIDNDEEDENEYRVRMTIGYFGGAEEIGHETLRHIDEFQIDCTENLTRLKETISKLENITVPAAEFLESISDDPDLKRQAEGFLEHYGNKERPEVIDEFSTRISRHTKKTFFKQAVMNQDFEKAKVTVALDSGQSIHFWIYAADSLYHYEDIGYRSTACIPDAVDISWQELGMIRFEYDSRIGTDHRLRLFIDGKEAESDLSAPIPADLGQGYHVIDLVLEYDAQIPIDVDRYFELISADANGREIPSSAIVLDLGKMPYALDCNDAFSNGLRLYEAGAYRFRVKIR
ncbi:hypothetical protein JW968_00050 [Candidatus Woesearchaeota archaeon]|nr:hypothetical protein [Candidatus Woesearchaeota archaeon]